MNSSLLDMCRSRPCALHLRCALVGLLQLNSMSGDTQMFVYYKAMSRPIAQQDFAAAPVGASPAQAAAAAASAQAEGAHFISAVCWKPHTNTLLAANSSGVVKICSLTHD